MATPRAGKVIDPVTFADRDFERNLQRLAHETDPPLLEYSKENNVHAQADRIIIEQGVPMNWSREQDIIQLVIRKDGTLSLTLNVTGLEDRRDLAAGYFLDPQIVRKRLQQAWRFCDAWWERLDPHLRHNPLMYNVAIYDIGSRRLETPPNQPVNRISVPPEFPGNPLVVFDQAEKVSRNDLHGLQEVERFVTMIGLRFRSAS